MPEYRSEAAPVGAVPSMARHVESLPRVQPKHPLQGWREDRNHCTRRAGTGAAPNFLAVEGWAAPGG